jgi:hypothetical protein
MKLCGPDELGVAAAIGSLGEALDRNSQQRKTISLSNCSSPRFSYEYFTRTSQ